MLVTAYNPSTDDLEKTFLAQSYAAAVTSVQLKNNQAFSNNARILIGEQGFAQSEIVTSGTPAADGTTLPITATLYAHAANTPVYVLQFDQVQFYRSTTGIDGTYTLLTTVPLDITNEDLTTSYDDVTAAVGYYYKVAMYNSSTAVTSALSDPIPGITGWARNQVGYLVNQILEEVTDPNEENVTRDEIMGYFNEVNDDILMNAVRPYNFLYTRTVLPRVAGANTISYPSNLWKFDRLDYNFVDNTTTPVTNNTYTVEVVGLAYFRNRHITNQNDSTTQDDSVQEMALSESTQQFVYYPYSATSSSNVWYLYYWQTLTDITTESQEWQTPTPRIYKLYSLYKYYMKRSVTQPSYMQLAMEYKQNYILERSRLKGQDRRDVGTPRRFEGEGWVRRSFRR